MEAKGRLAARLDELKQHWDHAETDELVHLARDLYEGLVELRYLERIAPKPSARAEPIKSRSVEQYAIEDPQPSERSEETDSSEPTRTPSEQPVTSSQQVSEQRSETPSSEPNRAQSEPTATSPQPTSASPKSKILIDFNDRWAFVNKLFDRNQDDFDRVVSQLNTMSTYVEARNFIEHVVKPDYNWSDQEEFEVRFMELIERHFI